MDYYIFRHASTFASKYNIPYGSKNRSAEILSEGIPATKRLAKYLKVIKTDANFTSPFIRCKETVAIVEKITEKTFVDDKRIGEFTEGYFHFGKYSKRIKKYVDDMNKKGYKSVAVCTHGGTIAGLKHWIIKKSFYVWNLTDYPHPGVLTIIKNGKAAEIDFNKLP